MFKSWFKSIAAVSIFCAVFSVLSIIETTYTRKATIIKIDNYNITAKDESGKLWDFLGDDFKEGEAIKLIMDDHHTLSIDDDIVKDVKKMN